MKNGSVTGNLIPGLEAECEMKRSTSSHNGLALLGMNLDPELHVASSAAFGDTLPECLNGAVKSGRPSLCIAGGPCARVRALCTQFRTANEGEEGGSEKRGGARDEEDLVACRH